MGKKLKEYQDPCKTLCIGKDITEIYNKHTKNINNTGASVW